MGLIRESFIFYRSFYESIKDLPADLQVEVVHAISEFALYGKKVEMSPVCKALFTAFVPSITTAKNRYDACVENGKKGATYGKKGGRPKTPKITPENSGTGRTKTPDETPKPASGKTPDDTPNETPVETGYEPLTDTVTVTDTVKTVSKKESKEKEILTHSSAGARAYERESYDELLTRMGFGSDLRKLIFEFIRFQQVNKKIVTNGMLEQTMACIKGAAERRIRDSLPGGYMENLKTDMTPYNDDVEQYIAGSIRQALDGGWFELREPKGFLTAAEWQAEADKDMGRM